MRSQDQDYVINEVSARVVEAARVSAGNGGPPLETLINDTIYHERRRLRDEKDAREKRAGGAYWKDVNRRLTRIAEQQQPELLEELVRRFVLEIVGNFNPFVYEFTTRVVPVGLGFLMNAVSPRLLRRRFPILPDIGEAVVIQGEVDALRALSKRATVILAPTHSSNLDSLVIGWSLHHLGLAPFIYGAGLNLFSNPLISFFMKNLGAYKVDRRKSAGLYKDILKEYCTVTLELGYDNLFFPGGTRSRAGEVERRLKLGLLGCGLRAYINNLREGRDRPEVYVVPATLSYGLVLEAENLIEDHLRHTGKSRFIITDDEFSQPRRILQFINSLFTLDARIYVTIAEPLDLFGNRVDEQGVSRDARGRRVDVERYVQVGGNLAHAPQRDAEYTRELGEAVARAYGRHNVVLSTNILAWSVYRLLRRRRPREEFYRFLRITAPEDALDYGEVLRDLERLLEDLRALEEAGRIRVDPRIPGTDAEVVAAGALRSFGSYHTRGVLYREGERLHPGHMELLYFYRNRLKGYGLEGE